LDKHGLDPVHLVAISADNLPVCFGETSQDRFDQLRTQTTGLNPLALATSSPAVALHDALRASCDDQLRVV
jgi:hypothetical protein